MIAPSFVMISRQGGAMLSGLLKAMGLRSLVHLCSRLRHPLFSNHGPEPPKLALRHSRLHALFRSVIHLIPMGVFTVLLFLNYNTFYYGPGLSVFDRSDAIYFALFQITAKVIELVCITSLCAILLQVLRSDLLHNEGLSLGLLTSASWFTSPVHLLSPEFLTSLQIALSRCQERFRYLILNRRLRGHGAPTCWRRTRIVILVLTLSLIAALIGPASAVLLIPKNTWFPAGGTTYFLNATFEEMWPGIVSTDVEIGMCFEANATRYPVCPSGGYSSFRYQGGWNGIYDIGMFQPNQMADGMIWFISSLVLDPLNLVPAVLSAGVDRRGARAWMPTYAIQPNLYSTIMQQAYFRDWKSAADAARADNGLYSNMRNFKYAEAVDASALSVHPITHIRCSVPQNLSGQADTIGFHYVENQPMSDDRKGWSQDYVTKSVDITALSRNYSNHVRAQWLPLSRQEFGPVSTGLLFEMPWTSSGNETSRLALSCSVAAAWAQGRHKRSQTSNYYAWQVNPHDEGNDAYTRIVAVDASAADVRSNQVNRHIELTPEWLNLLTPEAPDPPATDDSWRPSTLENMFHAAGLDELMQQLRTSVYWKGYEGGCTFGTLDPDLTDMELWKQKICYDEDKVSYIERTIARLITDGLSRRLSHRALHMFPNVRAWVPRGGGRNLDNYDLRLLEGKTSRNAVVLPQDPNIITQRLDFQVYGYGYIASSTADHLATVIIGVYLLISTSHVLWTILVRPMTSNAWTSALELVLLAYNSSPVAALRGTSAEIHRWDTYKHTVRVRAEEVNHEAAAPTKAPVESPDPKSELHLRLLVDKYPVRPRNHRRKLSSQTKLLDSESTTELSGVIVTPAPTLPPIPTVTNATNGSDDSLSEVSHVPTSSNFLTPSIMTRNDSNVSGISSTIQGSDRSQLVNRQTQRYLNVKPNVKYY